MKNGKKFILVSQPWVGDKEREYVLEAVSEGWISSEGKYVRAFEEAFSSYIGRRYGVAVNNGTNALILAFRALELPKGSEVILPSFTIISCALSLIYNDLVPVFVDSSPQTWNMDLDEIEAKITERTRAILMVHTYGYPCEVDRILEIARKHNLVVVEDFAEAIGSEYNGQKCGRFGDISCTSFYSNKLITTGEGGMCLTDDETLAQKMRTLRNLSFIPERRFLHYELGFNFRLSNVLAAIGLAQLESVEERIRRKLKMAEIYYSILEELERMDIIMLPPRSDEKHKNSFWMYGILMKNNASPKRIVDELFKLGIETRPFFFPLHLQPAFKSFSWYKEQRLPVSEYLGEYGFYIPSGLCLTEDEMVYVAENLKSLILKYCRL